MAHSVPSLPSSGASPRGLSTNFQPDLATGTGNYSIALDLPKGPLGFKPELTLDYSSGSGQGYFGQGWSLGGLMTIRVDTRKGVPDPANPDGHTYSLSGIDDLVKVETLPTGESLYRLRTDSGSWHIARVGDIWTVTMLDGTQYVCGLTTNSRVVDPTSGRIMEWHLSKITRPTGQQASFQYREFGTDRSIAVISYAPFKIEFDYDRRPDQFTNSRYGFPVSRDMRCSAINVRSARSPDGLLRSYKLDYKEGDHTANSCLSRVEIAHDLSHDADAFPALNFAYSEWSSGGISPRRLTFDGALPPSPSAATATVIDLEGRGLPGILEGTSTGWRFWRNSGDGRFAPPVNLDNAPIGVGLGTGEVSFVDLEGNGTADLLQISAATNGFYPNLADGEFGGFIDYNSVPPITANDPKVRFVDIDGDGIVDAIKSEPDAFLLYQNLGKNGWSDVPLRIPRIFDIDAFPNVDFDSDTVFFADMSGDGLSDIVQMRSFDTVYWPYLGHGRWGHKITVKDQPLFLGEFDVGRVRLIDIDGDGLADFVYLDGSQLRIWRNVQGRRWSKEITVEVPPIFVEDIDVIDILGYGRPALVLTGPDPDGGIEKALHVLDISSGLSPNLLTEIRSGLGHVTRIEYGVSTEDLVRDEDGGFEWSTFSPLPITVCRAVENADLAAGIKQRRDYRFHDAHYCGIEREFGGFNVVEESVTGSGSDIGKRTVTRFHVGTDTNRKQSDRFSSDQETHQSTRALRGSPLEVQVFETQAGHDDRKVKQVTSHYATRVEHHSSAGMVVRPFISQVVEDDLDTDGSANRLIWEYDPPNLVGQSEKVRHASGPVTEEGTWTEEASLTEQRAFSLGSVTPGGAATAFLASRVVTDGKHRIVSAERWLYDGDPFTGLPFGSVGKGQIVRHDELVYVDNQDSSGDAAESRGFFRIEGPELPAGWYRCRERKSYLADGNTAAILDAFDQRVSIEYDNFGIDPIKVSDAAGRVTQISYDHAVEQPRMITYPSGVVEQRDYDQLARVIASHRTHGDGTLQLISSVEYKNAEYGALDTLISPASITTRVCRRHGLTVSDIDTSITETTDDVFVLRRFYGASGVELGALASTTSDTDGTPRTLRSAARFFERTGRVVSEGRPSFDSTFDWTPSAPSADRAYVATLDALGRITQLHTPNGLREIAINPRSIKMRDPNSVSAGDPASILQEFDGFGRLARVEESTAPGESLTNLYTHDAKGDLLQIFEGDGTTLASFEYDRLSKRTKIDHRDAGTRNFLHDAMGRLYLAKTPTGQVLHYTYDAIGRLLEVRATEPDGKPAGSKKFYYDAAPDGSFVSPSRLCGVEENGELSLFEYDSAGRLTKKTRRTTDAGSLSFKYGYDFLGNITSLTYPNGVTINYRYGPSGEIVAIENFIDRVDYSERGYPMRVRYTNGVTTKLAFSTDDKLRSISVVSPSKSLFNEKLFYDGNGNITERAEHLLNDPSRETAFRYDRANRLTGGQTTTSAATKNSRISYDASGNLLSNSEHSSSSLSYDPDRRTLLTSVGPGTSRQYDEAGRTISTESLPVLRYDAFDRLRHVEKTDGTVVQFEFDYLGGRTRRTTQTSTTTSTVHSMDDLFERGEDGDRMIIRGPLGIAGIVSVSGGQTKIEFCHGDHLGSIRCRTNESADVVGSVSYTAFGLPKTPTDIALFAGKFSDDSLGLIQLGQRFYEPLTGRFLTPDTYLIERPEMAGGMPGYLNPFSYAANNPIRNVDPSGRTPVLAAIIIGAIIGAAIGAAAAQEQGEDPLMGALIGGLVGGLIGWAGLGGSALIGAGMGALTSGGDKVWTGAAVGGVFGAIGGAVGQWLPVIPGNSAGSMVGNFFLEVAVDGLVAGLSAGTTAAINGEDFGDAFESAFVSAAIFSSVRIAFFGVRYDPTSVRDDVVQDTKKVFQAQSVNDQFGPWSEATNKAGMPDINKVAIRRGGLLTATGRSHAIAPGGISLSKDVVSEISAGNYRTFAHELRHITQQNVANWGWVEFVTVWIMSDSDLHYTKGSKNTTPETSY